MKTSGNNNGESLVMIHGWGMNSGAWESVRPALETDYFMHWIDLPGYGENRNISANNMDDIVSLITPNIPDEAHLIGWSLGGLIAQAIAEEAYKSHFDKIKSLTLVASSPKFSQSDDWEHAISTEVLNNFSKNLQDDIEGTLKRFVALQFMGIKDSKAFQKALINEILADTNYKSGKKGGGGLKNKQNNTCFDALNLGLDILMHADYRNNRHTIPQHWILADRDRLIPPLVIKDLKLLRANDQITLLDNAGHAPFMTQPEEFLASVIPFIKSHRRNHAR